MHCSLSCLTGLTVLLPLLAGCVTSPFNKVGLQQVDRRITYLQTVQTPQSVRNRQALFGGQIITTQNFSDHSEIILLAFPLDAQDHPDTLAQPLGRMIVAQGNYLESVEYAAGRLLSVRGVLDGVSRRTLDQGSYNYPVMEIRELYLWPENYQDTGYYPATSLNIGVGLGLGF